MVTTPPPLWRYLELTRRAIDKPPPDSDANFTLTVVTSVRERGSQADTVAALTVEVDRLADVPTITVQNAKGETHGSIPLGVAAILTNTDGSEALSVTVRNVPDGPRVPGPERQRRAKTDESW
jgi:hypothetical protein